MDVFKVYLESNEIGYSEKLFESSDGIAGLSEPIVSYTLSLSAITIFARVTSRTLGPGYS